MRDDITVQWEEVPHWNRGYADDYEKIEWALRQLSIATGIELKPGDIIADLLVKAAELLTGKTLPSMPCPTCAAAPCECEAEGASRA